MMGRLLHTQRLSVSLLLERQEVKVRQFRCEVSLPLTLWRSLTPRRWLFVRGEIQKVKLGTPARNGQVLTRETISSADGSSS